MDFGSGIGADWTPTTLKCKLNLEKRLVIFIKPHAIISKVEVNQSVSASPAGSILKRRYIYVTTTTGRDCFKKPVDKRHDITKGSIISVKAAYIF